VIVVYIVLYNTFYRRQFEAVIPRGTWIESLWKNGEDAGLAAFDVVEECYRRKKTSRTTGKRNKALMMFLEGSRINPYVYGSVRIKVGSSKKEILDRGLGEYRIYSSYYGRKRRRNEVVLASERATHKRLAKGVRTYRIRKRDKSTRKRRLELYGYRWSGD
jgi:hypothetical protein